MTRIFVFLVCITLAFSMKAQPLQMMSSEASRLHIQHYRWVLRFNNELNQVNVRLDQSSNSIVFSSPKPIENVRVIVKRRGEVIIKQIDKAVISNKYSIKFPPSAPKTQYTVILQKDNHLLVERLDKTW